MLQQEKADDYVIATGEMHSVREFIELAFHYVGISVEWQGEGVNEKGIDANTKKVLIEIDPKYFRPTEVEQLLGNPKKAERQLNWKPKTTFEELVKLMTEADCKLFGVSNHFNG